MTLKGTIMGRTLVLERWLMVGRMLEDGTQDRTTGRPVSEDEVPGWTIPLSR